MEHTLHYKALILNAIQSIDLGKVAQVIQLFRDAQAHGRRIFVCGDGGSDTIAAQILCDLIKSANSTQASPFRILALSDQLSKLSRDQDELARDRVFVEQLKNFAEPGDLVMGISLTGNSQKVLNAIEYASWIKCRTIGLTGFDGGRLKQAAELNILVPSTHTGSIEDAHMVICRMVGYYFADLQST